MVGAATVAAALAAATRRKRRRVARLSLLDLVVLVIFSSPMSPVPCEPGRYLLSARQRLARSFGNPVRRDATLGRSPEA
jgi:hypothetical protein